jgi:hypothetical protein
LISSLFVGLEMGLSFSKVSELGCKMSGMSDKQGVSNEEGDQDDSEWSTNDTLDDTTGHCPLDPDMEKIHSRIDAHIKAGGTLLTVQVADLLGCTFISESDETGEQMRTRISDVKAMEDTTANHTQRMHMTDSALTESGKLMGCGKVVMKLLDDSKLKQDHCHCWRGK